jgi:hypothetical protein
LSRDIERRTGGTGPSFKLADDYILKRMIILIAFSQQVRSSLIDEIIETGVFERVFASYSPVEVAMLDPEDQISGMYLLKLSNDNRQYISKIVIRKE